MVATRAGAMKHAESKSSFNFSSPRAAGSLAVALYRLWHGRCRLKGAGLLIKFLAPHCKSLQHFPLRLDEGQTIQLDFRDISAACWLNHTLGDSFEETGLLKAMASVINETSVVWDVGANCGKVSYLLAKETRAKEVIFFEPITSMYNMSIAANAPFTKVSGINVALSHSSGPAELLIPPGNSSMAEIKTANGSNRAKTCIIECRVGDDLVSAGIVSPPNVIKIDTEGHELKVISGLRGVLAKHRPSIFLEHLSISDSEIRDIAPDGYEVFTVCNEDGSLSKGIDRSSGHNTALLPVRS